MPPREPFEIRGLSGLIHDLQRVRRELFTKEMFDEIATYVIFAIQQRTAKGVDADSAPFKPYTRRYSMFRADTGHTTKVNLFYTGSMMSSMTFDSTSKQTRIYFAPTEDQSGVSNPLKAFSLNQERRFFAMSSEDEVEINNILQRHIHQLLEDVTRDSGGE